MLRIHNVTLASLVAFGMLVLNAAPAGAETGYTNLCSTLETAFCTPGVLEHPNYGVAVDNSHGSSSGDVWIVDEAQSGSVELVKFDASGNQLAEIDDANIPVSAAPFFAVLYGVAVDPANGDVYVSSPKEEIGTVTKFDSSGVYQLQITGSETPQGSFEPLGLAVDPANGDIYVADGAHAVIDKFTSSGGYIEQFSAPVSDEGAGLAVSPEGNLYVGLVDEVREYSATGVPLDCPDGDDAIPVERTGPGAFGVEVSVDPSNGHIFVSATDPAGSQIVEYSSFCATVPIDTLGDREFSANGAQGIGVSGATHRVYAGNFNGGVALMFGIVTLPDVETGTSVGSITRSTAIVHGTVNPDETAVTRCEFEYGSTIAYGHSVPCSQPLPLTGGSPLQVSAEMTLSEPPASLVHYRLKVGNSEGVNVGEDETFYLESLPPPIVGGLPASDVSQFGATLNGTLETDEALVDYHFEYGTSTAYGSLAPIPDGYTPITGQLLPVAQPVGGLQAGTTYHYRLVASSPGGTEVAGPDETFTTLPVPAPLAATGGASGVGTGEATLSGSVDPHGWDTAYLFQYGTSTAYGSSWPSVLVDMGALEGAQPVIVNVPNLLPNTTYHYRLVASNGGGTSYGQDMTFTTGEYPAQVVKEPLALGTLLVPSGKVTELSVMKSTSRKAKKNKKSGRKDRPHHKTRTRGKRKKKK